MRIHFLTLGMIAVQFAAAGCSKTPALVKLQPDLNAQNRAQGGSTLQGKWGQGCQQDSSSGSMFSSSDATLTFNLNNCSC